MGESCLVSACHASMKADKKALSALKPAPAVQADKRMSPEVEQERAILGKLLTQCVSLSDDA